MKYFLFAVALWPAACATALAQKGLHLGVRYAPQASFYINSDDFDDPHQDPRVRFRHSGGLLLGYHFSDNIGVGTELTLSGEGIRYIIQESHRINLSSGYDFTDDVNLTYFKLPILFRFNTDPTKRAAFQGFVGPQFSFLTGANRNFVETYLGETKSYNYKTFDYKTQAPGLPYKENQNDPYWVRDVGEVNLINSTNNEGKNKYRELYKGMTIGAVLGLGFKIKVIESLYIDGVARLDFHFTDIEAKNKYIVAEYGEMSGGQFVKRGEFDHWDYQRTLLKSRRDDRAPSLMLSAGFQLGVTYILDFSK